MELLAIDNEGISSLAADGHDKNLGILLVYIVEDP
jgi:hypothetical protein